MHYVNVPQRQQQPTMRTTASIHWSLHEDPKPSWQVSHNFENEHHHDNLSDHSIAFPQCRTQNIVSVNSGCPIPGVSCPIKDSECSNSCAKDLYNRECTLNTNCNVIHLDDISLHDERSSAKWVKKRNCDQFSTFCECSNFPHHSVVDDANLDPNFHAHLSSCKYHKPEDLHCELCDQRTENLGILPSKGNNQLLKNSSFCNQASCSNLPFASPACYYCTRIDETKADKANCSFVFVDSNCERLSNVAQDIQETAETNDRLNPVPTRDQQFRMLEDSKENFPLSNFKSENNTLHNDNSLPEKDQNNSSSQETYDNKIPVTCSPSQKPTKSSVELESYVNINSSEMK